MSDVAVYRVTFSGDRLPTVSASKLCSSGVWLEASVSGIGPSSHWALVAAQTSDEAVRLARDAVSPHGRFASFAAEPARDANGAVWRGQFHRRWGDIDWDAVAQRVPVTDIERAALGALADAAEPTELVVREVGASRGAVESALRALSDQGLVESHTARFFDAAYDNDRESWWRLTHRAWDVLGFIKPVLYH